MTLTFYFLVFCWLAFAAAFLLRQKSAAGPEIRRDRRAFLPIAIQGVAFAIAWTVRRPQAIPLLTPALSPPLDFLACVLAAATVVWVFFSLRSLGKQWTVAARLIEGHKLVSNGPYSVVRNPIYTGMFGMLLSTGIILTRWPAFIIAIAIFLGATMWRIRIEEGLLRSQFGAEFEQYCKRVPSALLPGLL